VDVMRLDSRDVTTMTSYRARDVGDSLGLRLALGQPLSEALDVARHPADLLLEFAHFGI